MIKKILIIGGTGYIGTPLVKKLKDAGYDLTLLVRSENDFRNEFPGCKHFIADLLDKEALMKNINGFDLVVNLAAIIRTLDKKKYQENVLGMKNLIEVLKEKGVKRIIYFSTQSVNLKQKGPYAKSKEASEKMLLSSNLDYMIFRPNYVYGIDTHNDFYRMAFIAKKFRILPIMGDGKYRIQPVLRDDLVDIVSGFVDNFQPKSVIEISSEDTFSINEISGFIKFFFATNPLTVHLPVFILKLFKNFIPFDIDGYTEDRISSHSFSDYKFSSFRENLKKILDLLK